MPAGPHRWAVGQAAGYARTGIEAFVAYLDALFAAYPDRQSQMIAAARTRSRNNIAEDIVDVYPKQPDIAAKCHRRLANGLFLGTNLSNASKMQMARQVAKAAGASFGIGVTLELSE